MKPKKNIYPKYIPSYIAPIYFAPISAPLPKNKQSLSSSSPAARWGRKKYSKIKRSGLSTRGKKKRKEVYGTRGCSRISSLVLVSCSGPLHIPSHVRDRLIRHSRSIVYRFRLAHAILCVLVCIWDVIDWRSVYLWSLTVIHGVSWYRRHNKTVRCGWNRYLRWCWHATLLSRDSIIRWWVGRDVGAA